MMKNLWLSAFKVSSTTTSISVILRRGIFTSNYSYNLPCSGNNHEKSYNSHNSLRQYDFQFTDFQQLLQLMFNGIRNSQRSFRQYFSNYRRKQYIFNHFIMLFYYSSSSYLSLFATLFKKETNILSIFLIKYYTRWKEKKNKISKLRFLNKSSLNIWIITIEYYVPDCKKKNSLNQSSNPYLTNHYVYLKTQDE